MSGKVRHNRENFFIDLYWKGERIKLYSDKEGSPLYSERQANRLLERIRSEIDADEFNPKNYIKRELKALRLDTYVTVWLGRQKLRLEASEISYGYFREIQATVKNHLIPHLGTRDIRSMNKGHLDDFLVKLQVSPKSKKNILGVLRSIFTDAVDREDITRAPKFPRVTVADPVVRWIDAEAQDAILAQITSPMWKAYFTFLVHMGCRPSEARALRWEDVDFDKGLVTIRAGMDMNHYRPTTKEKDVRTLPLAPEAIEALRSVPRGLGYVFHLDGRPFSIQRVQKWWRRAADAAGIDIPLYQGTKHSMCCRARLEGVPLDVIQDWCGHKSAASTRRYAKLQLEAMKVMHRPQTVRSIEEGRRKANKKK
jgi:integrase